MSESPTSPNPGEVGLLVCRPWRLTRATPVIFWGGMLALFAAAPLLPNTSSPGYDAVDLFIIALLLVAFVPTLLHSLRYRLVFDEGRGTLVIYGMVRTRTIQVSQIARIRYKLFDTTRVNLIDLRGRRLGSFPVLIPGGIRLIQRLDLIAKNQFGANAGVGPPKMMGGRM